MRIDILNGRFIYAVTCLIWLCGNTETSFGQQPGDVDASFDPGSGGTAMGALVIQDDGKVIVGGGFTNYNGTPITGIARINPDGSLDTNYLSGEGFNFAMERVADGKVLVAGAFTEFGGVPRDRIARLNPDGSPDTRFGPVRVSSDNLSSTSVNAIHLFEDGRILIGGSFLRIYGQSRNNIAVLTADGTLDENFGYRTGADGEVRAILVEPDGQIVVGGRFTHFDDFPRLRLARLLPTGTLDLGFRCQVDTTALTNRNPYFLGVYALAQAEGKVLVAGSFSAVNGVERRAIARIFAGASPDGAPRLLSSPFEATVSEGTNLTLNADFTGVPFPSVEWRLNGSPIAGATGHTLRLHNILRKDAGEYRITLSNSMGVVTGAIATLTVLQAPNTPSAADVSFDPGEALEHPGSAYPGTSLGQPPLAWIHSLELQPDGRLLAGGNFKGFSGVPATNLVRMNPDGSLDGDFNRNFLASNSGVPPVEQILLQPDGKALLSFHYSGTNIVRLNPDGTRDISFRASLGPGFVGLSFAPAHLATQSNGKIIVTGDFWEVNGEPRSHIARLNSDGSLDKSFITDVGFSTRQILDLAVQADDRIIIVGTFTNVSGVRRDGVARLNADGSVDDSFSAGPGQQDGSVKAVLLQPDGKVLIGGSFTSFAGTARQYLTRLFPDGTLDPGFDPGTNANTVVQALALQPDGKILVAGGRYLGSAVQGNGIVRLQPDGSLDTQFTAAADDTVYDVVRLSDGRLAVGGAFSRFDNILRNGIALLYGDPALFDFRRSSADFSMKINTTPARSYTLEYRDTLTEATWKALPTVTGDGNPLTLTDPGPMPQHRFYRVRVN